MSHIINNNLSSPRTENKKRSTGAIISRSKPLGTLNSARRTVSIPPSKCSLCEKKSYKHSQNLITITHKTLYTKYASSQNYYYTKDINELLSDSHTPVVILHKDLQTFDENEEYLKRLYKSSEYGGKIKLLAEYYKFHWDIPRLFMMPITEVVNRYHDRKRRLQYLKVTKMLKDQKESKNPTIKRETEHRQKVEEPKPMSIADKLLVGLETSHSIIKQEAQRQQEENAGARIMTGQGGETLRRGHQVREGGLREQRQKKEEDEAHRTTFNTLHDLNLKLGEIVSNSQVRLADTNYFDNADQSLNESLSNLKNFLNYLQTNTGTTNIVPQPMSEITKIAQQTEVQQARPVLVEAPVKRATIVKSITPRLEKPREEDVEQQQGLRSTRAPVIAWNRADSTPMITPSPSEMARRGSAETKEAAKVEEKAKEAGRAGNFAGLGHMSTAQSSLSSTMTSKSKSVYSSVTKIRNFEEAVKISQQGSQIKLVSPVDVASNKYSNKPVLLRVNPSGTSGSQQEMGQREASPSAEFVYKGMDSSIKTPIGFSEDKSKESSNKEAMSPVSKHSSQVFSTTSGSKAGTRIMTAKNMTISSTRTMEGFMPRSPDMISPTNQSPNFRIKSHREAGTSFDRNAQNMQQTLQTLQTVQNVQIVQSPGKNVPQISMPSGRTHTRFGSGTFASPTGKSTAGKIGSPSPSVQTGRELKNLIALGALDVPIKEIKTIPNSASRKSDSKAEGGVAYSVKGSDGSATDREREAPPLSPKLSATPRGKLISHKHTRSEGGKLFKLDQIEMPMGSLNEQRIKELMRLSDVGSDAFSDCSQKLKKGEGLAKKMSSYNGSNNIANLVMSSNREMHYESVPSAPGSKKHQTNKASGDFVVSNGALISNRSTKPDVIVRKKSQVKKGEVAGGEGKQKKPPSPALVIDKFDEPRLGKPKALTVKGSGSFTPSNFTKGTTMQSKARGKQEFF